MAKSKNNNVLSLILGAIIMLLLAYIIKTDDSIKGITPPKTQLIVDYSGKPMNTLSFGLIDTMANNYRDNQKKVINNDLNIKDAHSVWFPLDSLLAFIYHMEMNADSNGVERNQLGLRMYYGAYDNENMNKKRHTLIMVPTLRRDDNLNHDYNPLDSRTYAQPLNDFHTSTSPAKIAALNHGGLLPDLTSNKPSGEAF
ncbi:MAG: hypothetical protein ACPG4W_05030 [Flavobacteriales bacterium]